MVNAPVPPASVNGPAGAVARAYEVLATVSDPEIPVLSVLDLGIVRSVEAGVDGVVTVGISPTYSGCPATAVIKTDIRSALEQDGFPMVRLVDVLSPPWSSDWISAEGRRKLAAYGIAPPPGRAAGLRESSEPAAAVRCPRCDSSDTELLSEFGSTPCKALHCCRACLEPFDCFKCI